MPQNTRPKNIRDIKPRNIFERVLWLLEDFVFGPLNLIDRIERVVTSIRLRDRGQQYAMLRADRGGTVPPAAMARTLKQYGVVTWGRTHNSKCIFFHVRRGQVQWVDHLLNQFGATLVDTRSGDIKWPRSTGKPAPTPWAEKR